MSAFQKFAQAAERFNTSGTDNPRSGRGSANLGWLGRSGRSDVLHKPFQFFVRLSADHEVFTCEKSRHCIDAVGSATAPVFIYRCFEAPAQQNIPGFVSRESDSLGDFDESLDFSDILDIDEIGAEQRVVNLVGFALALCPFGQLLREPAVVGHIALGVVGQPLTVHVHFHLPVSGDDFWPSHRAFLGSFRMQGELRKFDLKIIVRFEFLDTPGDEVAPGSNEIGKNFEHKRL